MTGAEKALPTVRLAVSIHLAGAELRVKADIRHDPGRLPALQLHAAPGRVQVTPGDGGWTALRYRLPLADRQVLFPDSGFLPWPVGEPAYLDSFTATTDGKGGGLVHGRDPHGGLPLVVAWPYSAEPRLCLGTGIDPSGLRPEVDRTLATLSGWLGPAPEVGIVDAVFPGAHAYSYPGLVVVHSALLGYTTMLLSQYLPHELAHQWFGNRLRFTGTGYLLGQECLPEALQARYVRQRWGSAAYQQVCRQYARPHRPGAFDRLLALDPAGQAALSGDEYTDLLAAGTRWWLDAFRDRPDELHAKLRVLAVDARTVAAAELVRRFAGDGREVAG